MPSIESCPMPLPSQRRHDLRQTIQTLEGLTPEDRSALLGLLAETKRYGLVWEDKPEDAHELLREQIPVFKEDESRRIVATRRSLSDSPQGDRIEGPVDDAPHHVLIEGDNLHALAALQYTHAGQVDVIYIDPPYNTGNKDFRYNDDYVDKDDAYRHSKWLAFMERRLKLAKQLLSPHGIILASIDDNEGMSLKLLLDSIFGEANFIDTLAIEISTTSGPKTVNAQQGQIVKNSEFIHIYSSSNEAAKIQRTPLLDGIDFYDTHYSAWLHDDGTLGSVSEQMLSDHSVSQDISKYDLFERGKFSIKNMDRLLSVSEAARNFIVTNLERIASIDRPPVSASNQFVEVGKWKKFEVSHRSYFLTTLANGTLRALMPLSLNYRMSDDYRPRFGRTVIRGDLWKGFHQDMGNVAKEGGVEFSNGKKPIRLIKQLIKWTNVSDGRTILDFFAGSGTTLHATMALNAEDGGKRQCILVTNNENKICEEVTYERNKRVIQGYTTPKGEQVAGLTANHLHYFKTEFVKREPTLKNRRQLMKLSVDLLRLKENAWDRIEALCVKNEVEAFRGKDFTLFVVLDTDAIPTVIGHIKAQLGRSKVYVFSPGAYAWDEEFEEVRERIDLCALPEAIYRALEPHLPAVKRIADEVAA